MKEFQSERVCNGLNAKGLWRKTTLSRCLLAQLVIFSCALFCCSSIKQLSLICSSIEWQLKNKWLKLYVHAVSVSVSFQYICKIALIQFSFPTLIPFHCHTLQYFESTLPIRKGMCAYNVKVRF